jgi:hypothetical protein
MRLEIIKQEIESNTTTYCIIPIHNVWPWFECINNLFQSVIYHIRIGKCGYLPSVKGCFHYKECTLLYIYIYIKTVVTGEKNDNLYKIIHVKLFNILTMETENFMKNNVVIIK